MKGAGVRTAWITVLGSGFAPAAPGTAGSLVAVLLWAGLWGLVAAAGLPRFVLELLTAIGIGLAARFSVVWGPWAIAHFGRADPPPFVLDEFAGQWVALLALPVGLGTGGWPLACAAGMQFLLFRIMDIVKPPPARQLEALPAGWGILADDLMAGVYANVAGQLLWRLTPVAAWLGAAS